MCQLNSRRPTIDASPPPMWTMNTCSFGWRSNTPEPIIRATLTVESKGRPTPSLRGDNMRGAAPGLTLHRWMKMDHDIIRFRKLPQPYSLGPVEEDAIRAVTVAGSHGDRLGVPLAD